MRRIGGVVGFAALAFVAGCAFGGGGIGVLAAVLALLLASGLLALGGTAGCAKGDAGKGGDGIAGSASGSDPGGWRSGDLPDAVVTPVDEGPMRVCLSMRPQDARLGPCLSELPPIGICLEPPVQGCLSPPVAHPPDAGDAALDLHDCLRVYMPCLSPPPPPDVCLRVGPCLTRPRPTVCLSVRPPVRPCLSVSPPPDVCLSEMPCLSQPMGPCLEEPAPQPCLRSSVGDPDGVVGAADAFASSERLASAGVLSPEQVTRLARLRGSGGSDPRR